MKEAQAENGLEVYRRDTLIFSSTGKWLHPLFELEDFLAESSVDPGELSLRDRIIGKAAAMLIVRLGIRNVYGHTMSIPAQDFLKSSGIEYGIGKLVERISCMTEEILADVDDIEEAHRLLSRRAGRPAADRFTPELQ